MTPRLDIDAAGLTRLLGWLSPAFPSGGFAYSHGLEAAREAGLAEGAAELADWLSGLLRFGSARNDAILLSCAHRAVEAGDEAALAEVAETAAVLFGAPELALESLGQGNAFRRAIRAAWPHPALARWDAGLPERGAAYPVAVAIAAAAHGIARAPACAAFLHAFAANGASAAIRLGAIGQTDGQRVLRALEPDLAGALAAAETARLSDIGSGALVLDALALAHETQATRLFRS